MKLFENFQPHSTVFYFRDITNNSKYITTKVHDINLSNGRAKITTINNERVPKDTSCFLDYTYKKLLDCFCIDLNLDNNFDIINNSLLIQNNSSSWLYLDNKLFLKDSVKYLEDFSNNFPQFKKPIKNYLLVNNSINNKFTKELSIATEIPFEFFNNSGTDLSVSKTQKENDKNLKSLLNAKLKRLECLDVSHLSTSCYEEYVKERNLKNNIESYNYLGKPSIGDTVILQTYNEFITVKVIENGLKNNEIMLMSDAFGTYIKPLSDLLPISYINMIDFFKNNIPKIYKNMSIKNSFLFLDIDPCFGYCHIKLCLISYTKNFDNFINQLSICASNHTKDIEEYLTKITAKNNEDKINKEIAITVGITNKYLDKSNDLQKQAQDIIVNNCDKTLFDNMVELPKNKFNKGDIVKIIKDFIVNLDILKVKTYHPDDGRIFEKNKIIESINLRGMTGILNFDTSSSDKEVFINIKGKNFFIPEDNLILIEKYQPNFIPHKPDKIFYDQAYESIDGIILPSTDLTVKLIQEFKNNR